MWIQIKNRRINLDNVTDYNLYNIRLTIDYSTIDNDGNQLGVVHEFDSEIEAKIAITKLDELLKVVSL
jgi:hypothetical protein